MDGSGPLLERESEISLIDSCLAASARGEGAAIAITGPAGIGKTRLLETAAESAIGRGHILVRARGDEMESGFSFGACLQLFEPVIMARPDRELFEGPAGLARPLFGNRQSTLDTGDLHPVFHGLYWFVTGLSEEAPVAIVVDDLPWIDRSSLRFLLYLLQRTDQLRVAIIVTVRTGTEGETDGLVRRLINHRVVTGIEPELLSETATRDLIRNRYNREPDRQFVLACLNATGGSPLYLGALLKEAITQDLSPDSGSVDQLETITGTNLNQTLRPLIHSAGDDGVSLARAAAVLGDSAELPSVSALAGLSQAQAAVAADRLAGTGLLKVNPHIAFSHPLVAESVRSEIGEKTLAEMHHRAAQLLRSDEGSEERVAEHLLRAGTPSEPWADDVLDRAGEAAAGRGDLTAAIRYWRAASDERGDSLDHGEARITRLALAEVATRDPAASETIGRALEAADDPEARAALAMRIGLALTDVGMFNKADSVFAAGAEGIDPAADVSRELRAARGAIGGLDRIASDPGVAHEVELPQQHESLTQPERMVLAHAALARAMRGEDADEAFRLGSAALRDASADPTRPADVVTLTLASTAIFVSGRLESDALLAVDEMIEKARSRGLEIAFGISSHLRAHIGLRRGLSTQAAADALAAIEAARYGLDPALPAAHAVLTTGLLRRGEIEAAEQASQLSGGEDRFAQDLTWNDLLLARARVALARNDPAASLELTGACHRNLVRLEADHSGVIAWRPVAVEANLQLGNTVEAGRLAEEDVAKARAFAAPDSIGNALRSAAAVSGGTRAIQFLREAIELLDQAGARFDLANAQIELGMALLDSGHRVAAREPLREALDTADRLALEPLLNRAREILIAAGGRPRRTAIRGRASLTPREQRLAEMAAEGMSNREIAASQFISVKTVETHLARAYGKLDIKSRADLGEALRPDPEEPDTTAR